VQACVFEGKESWVVRDVAEPVPAPDELIIEVKAAGVCGTDIHILKGEYFSTFPLIAGHEFSGIVAETGSDVKRFTKDMRVVADPNIFCDRCFYCKINKNNHCLDLQAVGVTRPGAFARFVAVPEKAVFPIPEGVGFTEAALAEPLACAVYGVHRSSLRAGEEVLIVGAGPIGLLLASLFREAGASRVVMTDISPVKLARAESRGVDATVLAGTNQREKLHELAPRGFDLVADATGIPQVMEEAFEYVQPDGTFLLFGVAPIGSSMKIDPYRVFREDLRIIGSFAVRKTMQYSLNLMAGKRVEVRDLVSSSYPLGDFGSALKDVLNDPDRLKVQIVF